MSTKLMSFLFLLIVSGTVLAQAPATSDAPTENYSDEKNVAESAEGEQASGEGEAAPAPPKESADATAGPRPLPPKATDKLPWPSLSSLYYDYKARNALQNKNPELALEYNLRILENEPNSVQTHSNIGIALDHLQKKDDAGQSFDLAIDLLEAYKEHLRPSDAFQIYYNLGLRFQNAKNTERALEYYQKALEINPASNETKHNIELLIQQQQSGGGGGKGQDQKPQDKDQNSKDGDDKDQKDKDQEEDRQQTSKYKPRPYQGDKLSEADVKKILGELSQQDKKIRANYNKKDRKEDKNAKDW